MFAGITLAQILKLADGSSPLAMAILAIIRSRHKKPPIVNEDGTPVETWADVHAKFATVVADLDAIEAAANAELAGGGD